MIGIVYGKTFLKSAKLLPKLQQKKLALLLEIIQMNPFDERLHSKHLTGALTGIVSFRITRDWRVMFQFMQPDVIQLLRVAHRKDIYL